MASVAGTTRKYGAYANTTTSRRKSSGLSRAGKNIIKAVILLALSVFILVSLSAYTATLQYDNNTLKEENAYLQAEIDSLNSQIVNETKVTSIEKLATDKYGMVYPTSDNCITIKKGEPMADSLAAMIKSEAYN